MNQPESLLKLQAYVDGELSTRERGAVETWIQRDPAARDLASELKQTRQILKSNEFERPLPVSPEFYWARIEEVIASDQQRPVKSPERPRTAHPFADWLRWFAPVIGVAAVMAAILLLDRDPGAVSRDWPVLLSVGHEVEIPSEAVSTITFRSERAGMTIVWVEQGR